MTDWKILYPLYFYMIKLGHAIIYPKLNVSFIINTTNEKLLNAVSQHSYLLFENMLSQQISSKLWQLIDF